MSVDLLDVLHPLTISINNMDVSAYYETGSLAATLTIGQELDTCTLALQDFDGGLGVIVPWDEVRVIEHGYEQDLFTGYVVAVTQTPQAGGVLVWELTCLDEGVLAQKIIIDETYTSTLTGVIMQDLCAKYMPWLDRTSKVAAGSVQSVRFDRKTLAEAFKTLADLDGYEFWVKSQTLHYLPPGQTDPAPFGLSDAGNADYVARFPCDARSLRITRDGIDVRNRVVVHGGMRASDPVTEVFTGNGVQSAFTVTHAPVHVFITVLVAGESKRFGREFIDDPARFAILTNWQHGMVKFDLPPALGVEIQVVYTYQNPVRVTVVDDQSALLYCPPGLVDYFTYAHVDGSLTTDDAADTAARAILAQYAYEHVSGEAAVQRLGILAGQRLQITDATLGYASAEFLVQSCQIEEIQPGIFRTSLRFGNRQPSFVDAVRGLAGGAGGIAAGASGGQGDILQAPSDLRQPTGYMYVTLADGEKVLVPVYHQLIGTGQLDYSKAQNSQYIPLGL